MKVLVVGGGAREHALAWKFRQERAVTAVLTAPGNPGMAALGPAYPVAVTDIDGLVDLARSESVDLTVVGPEAPLDRGLADAFASEGLVLFGPARGAARLETSKAFAKHLMGVAGVPTARYRVAETPEQAIAAVEELGGAVALKADGLAAGKGVIVAENGEDALNAIEALMVHRKVGDAGRTLVVEERLQGPEVSFFAIADGDRAIALASAQDHKRALDGDQGPNTGGMGAFSPSPLLTLDLEARVMFEIVNPVIDAMKAGGTPFRGFLYVGLMLTEEGPKVIEFNVRLGDPEAQVVLPRLKVNLAELLMAAASDGLPKNFRVEASDEPRVGVVMAAAGYPEHVQHGQPIDGLDRAAALDDVLVFHGGTRKDKDRLVTAGGRVLTVVGGGRDFPAAIDRAYAGVDAIRFEGAHVRRDIGRKALAAAPKQG
jgi:phosphoribosylamine--glycine ligase